MMNIPGMEDMPDVPEFIEDGKRNIANTVAYVRSLVFTDNLQKDPHYIRKFLAVVLSETEPRFDALLNIEAVARGMSLEDFKSLVKDISFMKMAYDMELAAIEYEYSSKLTPDMTFGEFKEVMDAFHQRMREFQEHYAELIDKSLPK